MVETGGYDHPVLAYQVARLVLLATGAGALAACSPAAPENSVQASVVRYLDLGSGLLKLESSQGEVRLGRLSCADQSRHALLLRPEETVELGAMIGHDAELVLTGCLRYRPTAKSHASSAAPHGRISVTWAEGGRRPVSRAIESPPRRWWDERLRLPGPAGAGGNLRLTFEGTDAFELVLQNVYVRHQQLASTPKAEEARRILLISVDTLREDAISALGGDQPTPHLDAWVNASQTFLPHYAAASWTKPSHASMLTGRLPAAHGVQTSEATISEHVRLVSERLAEAGFETHAHTFAHAWLHPRWGFGRGFASFEQHDWQIGLQVRRLLDWLAEHRDRDLFVFFHTFEPHSDFVLLPYEGPGATTEAVHQRFGVGPGYGCREEVCGSLLLSRLRQGSISSIPGEDRILKFLYERGVAETDRWIGELVQGLRELELYEDTLILLTSDHGEALLEQPMRAGHGSNWETVLRVPLLIKWPGGAKAGTRIEIPTSALDLVPTILRHAGLSSNDLPGRALQDVNERSRVRPVFSGTVALTIWTEGYKLHVGRSGEYLFNLLEDPEETSDLSAVEPETFARLHALLERRTLAALAVDDANPSAQQRLLELERKQLEALGYLNK